MDGSARNAGELACQMMALPSMLKIHFFIFTTKILRTHHQLVESNCATRTMNMIQRETMFLCRIQCLKSASSNNGSLPLDMKHVGARPTTTDPMIEMIEPLFAVRLRQYFDLFSNSLPRTMLVFSEKTILMMR
jgi:hypothetical protein